MWKIYLVTNKINNKKYVGQTKNSIQVRFRGHISSAMLGRNDKCYFHASILKYGPENFELTLLEDNIPTQELADEREKHYIKLYNTFGDKRFGYNETSGGQGCHDYVFSEEALIKKSNSMKGHVFPKERNDKISKALTGRVFTDEWKSKISDFAKTRTGEKNPFYGKHHTAEAKNKLRVKRGFPLIAMLDKDTEEVIMIFDGSEDAGRWVVDNKLTTAKPTSCAGRIRVVCTQKFGVAYGYKWKFMDRCID